MTTMTSRGWTPVRSGKHYCSPRCGRGCTYEEFRLATEEADKLAGIMGDGWEPVVWENLGWHYKVVKGAMGIYPRKGRGENPTQYWANIICKAGQFHATESDPLAAYGMVMQDARTALELARQQLDEVAS